MALTKEAREFFVREGRKGGKLAARKMTKEERQESARRAAQARWANVKKDKERATADVECARQPVTLKAKARKAAQKK